MNKGNSNFSGFLDKFSKYMQDTHPQFCFYGYGSCFQNQTYRASDIDGGIIVPEIITDKKEILELSRNLSALLTQYDIRHIDFNLIDIESSRDGRFLSYTTDYTDYIKQKGIILAGPNLLSCLNGLDFKIGILEAPSFNFRSIRNSFLMNSHFIFDSKYAPEEIVENIRVVRGKTESLPKKLIQLKTREILEDKYEAVRKLQEIFPNLDLTFFDMLRVLRDRNNLEKLLQNPDETFNFWSKTLETFESLIKAYIEKYPPQTILVETQI